MESELANVCARQERGTTAASSPSCKVSFSSLSFALATAAVTPLLSLLVLVFSTLFQHLRQQQQFLFEVDCLRRADLTEAHLGTDAPHASILHIQLSASG